MENTISDLAGLPCDLVSCIGDRLDVLARVRFRAVCRSWRAALPAVSVTWSSPLVVLPAIPNRGVALPDDRSVADSCGITSALALHLVDDSKRRHCVGSSGMWLAVADSESVIRLVNAMTLQEAACLPPLPCPRLPGSTSRFSYYNIRDHQNVIHKVAFSVKPPRSGSGYAHSAAALHRAASWAGDDGLVLSFTRAGWDHWKWGRPTRAYMYPIISMDGQFDVAYCQQSGMYYVVTPLGSVWVLDVSAPVPTLEPLVICHESIRKPASWTERRHLVVLPDNDGGPTIISKPMMMYFVMIKDESEESRVVVHKYTAAEESWWLVSHLHGRALLISTRAQSVLVLPTASSPWWLRTDCVYWMTGYKYPGPQDDGTYPVWCFHLPTKTTHRFLQRHEQLAQDYYRLDWRNSFWLSTPSLT